MAGCSVVLKYFAVAGCMSLGFASGGKVLDGKTVWEYGKESMAFCCDENPSDDVVLKNIPAIADMLPEKCEFVVFDACNMSTMAVAYEFKDKVENLLLSVYIAPGNGLHYDIVLPMRFKGDYKSVINNYYFSYLGGGYLSMSWIKTNLIHIKKNR
ncbi:MAG: clostripain-related cysteine peptidase [Mucinivorans sp.]